MTSAEYFAKKCGKVTISVTNNQFPLAPLFSPIYSTTRPYSCLLYTSIEDFIIPFTCSPAMKQARVSFKLWLFRTTA